MSDPLIQRGLNHLEQMEAANHKISLATLEAFLHFQGYCVKCPKPISSTALICDEVQTAAKSIWKSADVGKLEVKWTQMPLFQ